MPQLCVGNQAHPHDWDVASCSRKYKYDTNSLYYSSVIGKIDYHHISPARCCKIMARFQGSLRVLLLAPKGTSSNIVEYNGGGTSVVPVHEEC